MYGASIITLPFWEGKVDVIFLEGERQREREQLADPSQVRGLRTKILPLHRVAPSAMFRFEAENRTYCRARVSLCPSRHMEKVSFVIQNTLDKYLSVMYNEGHHEINHITFTKKVCSYSCPLPNLTLKISKIHQTISIHL